MIGVTALVLVLPWLFLQRTPYGLISGLAVRGNIRLDQLAVTGSGGEQQVLVVARPTVSRPRLVTGNEPSKGIMPVPVDEAVKERYCSA